MPEPGITIVGRGTLGSALIRRLEQRGHPPLAVLSRADAPIVPPGSDLLILCTQDRAIAEAAARLATGRPSWDSVAVAHTSGAASSAALRPFIDRGAVAFSFHPMQTFPPGSGSDAFDGVYAAIEGDAGGIEAGHRLAEVIGVMPFVLDAAQKALYHAAGVMASNYTVTLLGLAEEMLTAVGLPAADGRRVLAPMMRTTLANVAAVGPEASLTGPAVRGDAETLERHLEALSAAGLQELVPAYRELARQALRLAVRSGRLQTFAANELVSRLDNTPH